MGGNELETTATAVESKPTVNNPTAEEKESKTFTQEEVNKMLKAEKEKSKRAVLKELGVDTTENAKADLQDYKKYLDSKKTELEKASENFVAEKTKAAEAEKRALKAEYSLKAIAEFNAVPESVNDLIAIAMLKVNDGEKEISDVLKEMQESKAYSGFFKTAEKEQESKPIGTGLPVNNKKSGANSTENYGAKLAKARMAQFNILNNGGNNDG